MREQVELLLESGVNLNWFYEIIIYHENITLQGKYTADMCAVLLQLGFKDSGLSPNNGYVRLQKEFIYITLT